MDFNDQVDWEEIDANQREMEHEAATEFAEENGISYDAALVEVRRSFAATAERRRRNRFA